MRSSYKSGLFSEFIARMFLRLRGYSILESRYVTGRYTGRAEIDIIARDKNTIIFIEVKNRADAATGIRAVSHTQHERLRRAAKTYLARRRWTGDARFDIMVVRGFRVQWFKNAV
ncbi:MAG: YraN family protein [Alphaproteobacteria bacterium]|nr:YraN family protein [Alphaproteobacteria bacterium]MCL2890223.1 YraN family protein [Alphaproteobacteria bacterium]